MERQVVEIGFLVNNTGSDQNLVAADAECTASPFGRAQQRRCKDAPQAVQFVSVADLRLG